MTTDTSGTAAIASAEDDCGAIANKLPARCGRPHRTRQGAIGVLPERSRMRRCTSDPVDSRDLASASVHKPPGRDEVYVLVAFMFGIAVISLRAATRDRSGLGGVPLLCLCAVVAVAYYGALRLV